MSDPAPQPPDDPSEAPATSLLRRMGLDSHALAREEADEQRRHLRCAYFEQQLADLERQANVLAMDTFVAQNSIVHTELKSMANRFNVAGRQLRAGRDVNGQALSEPQVGVKLRDMLDNLSRYGLWRRLDHNYSDQTRERMQKLQQNAEELVAELLHPEHIDPALIAAYADAQDAGATPAPSPVDRASSTVVSRRRNPDLPSTIKSSRPSPAPVDTPAQADDPPPADPPKEAPTPTSASDEQPANMRRMGQSSHDLSRSTITARRPDLEKPPTAEEQAEIERALRKQNRDWRPILVRSAVVVASLVAVILAYYGVRALLSGLGEEPPPVEAAAPEVPDEVMAEFTRHLPPEVELVLPEGYADIPHERKQQIVLAEALVDAFLAAEGMPEGEALRTRIVDAFVAITELPWAPAQPPITLEECKQEAQRLAAEEAGTPDSFPIDEVVAEARRRFPAYELGERVSVTYELNPTRIVERSGPFGGRQGDIVLVGNYRLQYDKIIVTDDRDLLRLDPDRARDLQDRFIRRQRLAHAERTGNARLATYAEHLQEQVDIAQRINEANGYISYRGQWLSAPQLIQALLAERQAPAVTP